MKSLMVDVDRMISAIINPPRLGTDKRGLLQRLLDAKEKSRLPMSGGQDEYWKEHVLRWLGEAHEYNIDFESLGIPSDTTWEDITEEQAAKLREAINQARESERIEEFPGKLKQERQKWFREWGVPETEQAEFSEYPVVPSTQDVYMSVGGKGRIGLTIPEAGTLSHEMAHAVYFEQMPESLRGLYEKVHRYAQMQNPLYKEQVGRYPGGKGYKPREGYAMAYQTLGKQPERMPWYIEPFYGNLMYPVPDLPGELEKSGLVWLASWLKDRLTSKGAK